VTAGWHWKARPWLSALADIHLPVDHRPFPSFGLEARGQAAGAILALRAGYSWARAGEIGGLTGLSAGFGVDLKGLRMDYAWVPMGQLGTTHRATLAIRL